MKQILNILNFTCLDDFHNMGQRLQTYALHKFIEENFSAILYVADYRNEPNPVFADFENRYLHLYRGKPFNENDYNRFDLIMYGSDQCFVKLGNANFQQKMLYYSDFFKDRIPIVSYSASANGCLLNRSDCKDKIALLSNFSKISLREIGDVKQLKTVLSSKDIEVHIDPTLLLSEKDWLDIARKPKFIEGDVLFDFDYTLVNAPSKVIVQEDGVKKYVYSGNTKSKGVFELQPDEFLWMVKHCRNYTSKSFHGQVFGLILKKHMQVTQNYRISNMLNLIGARVVNGFIDNFEEIGKSIEVQKRRSFNWINDCFYEIPLKYALYTKGGRNKSTSGGLSAMLAEDVISKGGVVYGASYSEDFKKVQTVCVDNIEDYFRKIAKSKYSECQMPDLNELKQRLDNGELVLFTGCPCQIKSLMQFLKKDYANLITVDLLCNGYSRNEFLRKTVEEQEQIENSRVVGLDMRPRHGFDLWMKFENGKEKTFPNLVTRVFVCNKKNYLDSCLTCNMHLAGKGCADLTIGDFWEYKKYTSICDKSFTTSLGTSVAYVNTEKGRHMMNDIKPNCEWRYLI